MLTKSRLEMKMPVAILFTLVFHITSFAVATTKEKQACPSLFKESSGTILIIDSFDSCILLRYDNSCLT